MKKIMSFAMLGALAVSLTATSAWATTLSITDPRYLGLIDPNNQNSLANEVTYINTLIGLNTTAPGNTTTVGSGGTMQTITRSTFACPTCPTATDVNAVRANEGTGKDFTAPSSGGLTLNITNGSFAYLLAKYDGKNFGALVWDVRGLTSITIPAYQPNADKYKISHFSLFNPTGTPDVGVPDGGMTLMLLGGALVGFETLRRKLRT